MLLKQLVPLLGVASASASAAATPLTTPSSSSSSSTPLQPDHDSARQNAHAIFNAIHSTGRQWGSSVVHNGFALLPAVMPAGSVTYHGTHQVEVPDKPEWLAFEPEHAMNFGQSWTGRRRGPGGPPPGGKPSKDGEKKPEGKPPGRHGEEKGHLPPHWGPAPPSEHRRKGHGPPPPPPSLGEDENTHGPPMGHEFEGDMPHDGPHGPPHDLEDDRRRPHGPQGKPHGEHGPDGRPFEFDERPPHRGPPRPEGHDDHHGPPPSGDHPDGPPPNRDGRPFKSHDGPLPPKGPRPGHHDRHGDRPDGPSPQSHDDHRGPPHDCHEKPHGPPPSIWDWLFKGPPRHPDGPQPHQDGPREGHQGPPPEEYIEDEFDDFEEIEDVFEDDFEDTFYGPPDDMPSHHGDQASRPRSHNDTPRSQRKNLRSKRWGNPQKPLGQTPSDDDNRDDDEHRGPPPPPPGGDDGDDDSFTQGYLHTYRATRDLHLVLMDGMSAGKSDLGTMDSQDALLRGKNSGLMDEWVRAREICDIITPWGYDGFARVEVGFEVVYCDFHNGGLEQVSALRSTARELQFGEGHSDAWQWVRAVAERYDGLGSRLRVDYSSAVSGYFFPLNTTSTVPGRPDLARLGNAGVDDLADVRAYFAAVSQAPRRFTVDWQAAVVDQIEARWAERLALMAHEDVGLDLFEDELDVATGLYVDAEPPARYNNQTATAKNETAAAIGRCVAQYLVPNSLRPDGWSLEDDLIHTAITTTVEDICETFFTVRTLFVDAVAAEDEGDDDDDESPAILEAFDASQDMLRSLMDRLLWTRWQRQARCAPGEVEFIAMWPFGDVYDHFHPGCRSVSYLGRIEGHNGRRGNSYWRDDKDRHGP